MGGLVGTKETARKEGASEAEAVGVTIVVATTAVVALTAEDMTVAVEVDLLVWGKLHMPLPLRYPFECLIIGRLVIWNIHLDMHLCSSMCSSFPQW